jgi:hypothetical protein
LAILDELLPVHEPDGVSELRLEDAMLIKTVLVQRSEAEHISRPRSSW